MTLPPIDGDTALKRNKKHESNGSSHDLFRSYETSTVQYYARSTDPQSSCNCLL